MKIVKTITTFFMIFNFVSVFLVAKAESLDSEAISQVSKGIAEWKLMNEDKEQAQSDQTAYVSNSLSGMVEKGGGECVGVIKGLASFDNNDYWIRSEIRNWELNTGIEASNSYISRLPANPWVDVAGDLTTRGVGIAYDKYMHNQLSIVNVFRGYQGNAVLTTFPRSWQIASATYDIASSGMGAGITFAQTIDSVGKSMQTMNPPIYLQNSPKFTSSQKILGIPISGTWEGSGSYRISSGVVNYQETLKTSGPGPITQTHTDFTTSGTYYRQVEIKTPSTIGFERFAVTHYPVGSYFDPTSSSVTMITKSQQSYRVETVGGVSKVTALPSSGIGTWGYSGAGGNWNVGRNTPLPAYTQPVPSVFSYKPTLPVYSYTPIWRYQ